MTVQKDVTKNIYVGNGSTRTFPFTFECPAEHPEYIKVYLMQDDGTALATSDYQLDMDARQITYPSSGTALPEGKKLVIMRELPLQQMMNLVNNGPYFAEDVETAFDENVMAMQQIAEKLNRSIIMSVDIDGDAFVNEVPFEAGKSFRIADDGKSIVLTEDPAKVLPLAQSKLEAATAQANIAAASAAAAAKSENNAAISASASNNSAQSASTSAASAAESARLAEGYKTAAETAKSDASLYAANAKTSADNATASKEAAQSAATSASNFATDARNSAGEAKTYKDNAKTYMDNAKNYSENVNVFIPSVSTSGVLSWTNKAGFANPPSVNIKGEKGDQGLQGVQGVQGVKGDTGAKGDRGATGAAATIRIGTVTTGASGSEAVVTNVGTDNDAVFNFRLPRGEKGADGGIEIDNALSDTSINPVQNKVVKAAIDTVKKNMSQGFQTVTASIPTKVSTLENDAGYLTQHQSLDNYAKTNQDNNFSGIQTFQSIRTAREDMPYQWDTTTPTNHCGFMIVSANTTIDLSNIFEALPKGGYMAVYTCIIQASNDYSLTITGVPNVHYIGSASDCSIKAPGVLLNALCWRSGEQGTDKDVCVLVSAFS